MWRSYEAVLQEAERDRKFAELVTRAADRVLRFKGTSKALKHAMVKAPSTVEVQKLAGRMRAFAEEVRQESAAGRL